ncbi:Membrane fusion mating FIG1 protein [Rutstroemia sp. NJR-2017a BVV2]|nr:Membrane fusion mating FIG1 protein [Rutstroemia sp. NJR-2017a BVV2]
MIPVLIAGCTSTTLSNVYLLSLSYADQPGTAPNDSSQINPNVSTTFANLVSQNGFNASMSFKIRVGFLGFCLADSAGTWVCERSAKALANFIRASRADRDPLNVVWIAKEFQEQSLFSGLWIASIVLMFACILLLITYPGWHEEEDISGRGLEDKIFPPRTVSQWALVAAVFASLFALVSAIWQHITCATGAAMVRSLSYGTVQTVVGPAAMILAWGSVFLVIVATIGLLVMILSIRVLAETFG